MTDPFIHVLLSDLDSFNKQEKNIIYTYVFFIMFIMSSLESFMTC